jgi:hypothetical protein
MMKIASIIAPAMFLIAAGSVTSGGASSQAPSDIELVEEKSKT